MFESNGASAARIGASQPAITTPPIGVPPVVNLPLSVKVLSPNGGTLTPGQVVTIQWQSSGAASQSVKYTLDGATYIDIINDLPGTATSTQWTVPQASTTVARVRVAVRDAAGTRLTDDSDSPITIQPAAAPSILSVTPASGPVAGGNQVTISGNGFTQGCVVRFGGTDAQVIGVTPSQVIAIAPAQAVAGPVNIRLVNPDGQFVVASSAYTYVAVALTVRVLSPNGGERLQPGQAVTIQWQSSGAASQSVKYTLDGATYIDIVNDLPGTAASTQWVVPQANTSIARVRVAVRDAAGTRVTDDSDTPFTIQPISTAPTITLVTPSSGPASGGTTVTIIGQNFQAGCVVRFDGIDAQVLSVTPTQVVVRTPVANPGATAVNIRLVNPDGQFVVASGAYTYIATPLTVKVLSPNGGSLQVGQSVTIQWQSSGATSQSVKYTLDGATYIDIVNDLPGTVTSTQWTVPQASTNAARVRVAVRDAQGNRVTDDSDSPITIIPVDTKPAITMVAPNSGPASGGTTVTIGGRNFQSGCVVRFDGVDAQVLSVTSTQVVVRTPVANPGATAVNIRLVNPDGQFVVASGAYTYIATPLTVRVLSPNGGERLQPGQSVTIQWQSSGAASQSVKYTLDGATYIDIVNDLPGTATSTQWVVPQASTTTARVRVAVRDAAGTRVTDDSDTPFTIQSIVSQPAIAAVTPMSGPASGGTLVTIDGQGFRAGCSVRFGSLFGTVQSVTDTRITVKTPVSSPGLVDVRVTNADGGSATRAGGFRFTTTQMQASPQVRSIQVTDPDGIDPTEQFVTTANSGSVNAGKILVVELYYVTIPPDLNLSFNLFALGVPPGVQVGFSPNPMSYATIYMTITTELTTVPGDYTITIAGEGQTEDTFVFPFDFLLHVDPPIPRVKITAANTMPEVTAGGGVSTVPLTLKRKNFPGPVTLTANGVSSGLPPGLPEGVQVVFAPQPASGDASILNFVAAPGTAPGDYPVVISAEKKDGLVKVGEAMITLHVKSTGTLKVSISGIKPQVPNLGCATYSVTVTPENGLRGKVMPSVMNLPPNIISQGKMPTFNPPELDIDMNVLRTTLTLPIKDDVTPDGSRKQFSFNVGAMTKDGLVKAKPVEGSLAVDGLATVAVKPKPKNPDRRKILAGQKATFRLVFDRAQPDECMQLCMKELKAMVVGGEPLMPGFKMPRIVNDGLNGQDIIVEVETTAEAKGSKSFMIGAMRPNMEKDVMVVAGMITVEIVTVTIDVASPMPGAQFQGFENITFMWTTQGDTQAVRTVDFELMVEGVAQSIRQPGLPGGTTMMNLDLPNPGGTVGSVHDALVRITGRGSNAEILATGEQSFSIAHTGTPVIHTVGPNPAKRGAAVDIDGLSFIPGKTQVFFTRVGGMVEADISELTATHIRVTVPDDAISGSITVRNTVTDPGDDHDTNADFTVDITGGTPSPVVTAPQISSLSPVQGPVGTRVQIAGSSFTGARGVTFNGMAAQFQVLSSSLILAFVPAGARTGPVTVTTAGGTARSAVFFQVTTLPTGGPVGGPIIRGPIGGGLAGGRIPGGDLPDQGPGF